MNAPLWTLDRVSLGSRLRDLSLGVEPGVTAVLGQSGAGKTSLLNLLVGFERPTAGTIDCHVPRSGHARPMYWVPQDDGLWPHLTAREHLTSVGLSSFDADTWLARFDLSERVTAHPQTLSRGERARLSVARALAADACVLAMDEPLGHVDPARVGTYWECLRGQVAKTGGSLVFATHAPATVLAEAQHVVCLNEGRLIYTGRVEDLYWAPPTPETAACLGAGNWMEPADMRLWLRRETTAARCLRPEQIALRPAGNGALVVESARFHGAVAEAQLRHEPSGNVRRFWHRPAGNHLPAGARVSLEVVGI